jgi:lipoprotein NlpI
MRCLVIPLLLSCLPIFWSKAIFARQNCEDGHAAKLVSLQGKLFFDPSSKGQWQGAQLNDNLCEGGRIRVDNYSRAIILLPSGIILRLHEGTVLSLNAIAANQSPLLDMLKGFVHFISRTPKRLSIITPIANAGPEGTEFALSVDDSHAALWVYEGRVKFFNTQGSVSLKPGQGAQAQLGQAPKAHIDIKPQDAVNWALYYPPVLPYPDSTMVVDDDIRSAIAVFRQGHIDVALSRLDALAADKQSPYFYKVRAAMRLTVGLDALALQDIQVLLASHPHDAEALALQSIRSLTQNRKNEAYALANQAVAADAKSATAYSALSYAEQGRFELDKALQASDKATQLASHDAMVWARKAELELSLGLMSESRQTAQRASGLDASLERTQTVLGFANLLSMDADAALQSFETAVKLDSVSPLARLGLGLAKIRQGNLQAGRQDLEIAAVLDPANSLIRSYLGKAYYEEKRNSLAEDQFSLAKLRDAKDPTPYFYDAIRKQTINRPVEALHDMQKAIELNDNRAVFRSKLMLDKDVAARQAGLGRIFNGLGFDDVANRQAMKALAIDPSNYSAHRLLSDSYATKPRQEIARTSEYLQSQLLQPLNYNPIQPSLAYTDLNIIKGVGPSDTAFNEYNRLFERNGIRFTTTGIAGSNNTFGDEAALSVIINKFSYSLGQLHYETDGFRKNNDLKHNLYNVFAQYEVSPAINLQAEYGHRETDHGDLQIKGESELKKIGKIVENNFDDSYHRQLKQDKYRIGLKISPVLNSDILFSFIHNNREETSLQNNGKAIFNPKSKGYNFESQYLFHNNYINRVAGLGLYRNEVKDYECLSFFCGPFGWNSTQYFSYFYSNYKFSKNLNITAGLSFDHYNSDRKDADVNINELNPKLGFLWKPNDFIGFRAAIFKSVKSAIFDSQLLQPTQIVGFNQFFDDYNGTVSWLYGIGLDAHINNIYSGIEAYKRELKVPFYSNVFEKHNEEMYRIYFNFAPIENFTINSEFRFENFRAINNSGLFPELVETAYIPLEFRWFHSNGLFSSLKGTYVNQKMTNQNPVAGINEFFGGNFNSDFYLVDAAIGYRFPKQYGLISFEAKNIFDCRFRYRDRQFQMNEQRSSDFFPERMLFARLTFNF